MRHVDVRWRPSGGRGEYEHVPNDVLLGRKVIVDPISVGNSAIETDVWGRMKDGKPRLRRENPNSRDVLNLPQLVAALALLPDSIREDQGQVVLPLRNKGYVISSISFLVDLSTDGIAVCTPQRMCILHDSSEIDLVERLQRVGRLLSSYPMSPTVAGVAASYFDMVQSGKASAAFRAIADDLLEWLAGDARALLMLDSPSEIVVATPLVHSANTFSLLPMSADETKRKLTSHYRIDRSKKIRRAKIEEFKSQYGAVYCENCAFDFFQQYGERGKDFIEVHHKVPLAALLPNVVTYLSDLLLLCSNCHRIVHRRRPDLSPGDLANITRRS